MYIKSLHNTFGPNKKIQNTEYKAFVIFINLGLCKKIFSQMVSIV